MCGTVSNIFCWLVMSMARQTTIDRPIDRVIVSAGHHGASVRNVSPFCSVVHLWIRCHPSRILRLDHRPWYYGQWPWTRHLSSPKCHRRVIVHSSIASQIGTWITRSFGKTFSSSVAIFCMVHEVKGIDVGILLHGKHHLTSSRVSMSSSLCCVPYVSDRCIVIHAIELCSELSISHDGSSLILMAEYLMLHIGRASVRVVMIIRRTLGSAYALHGSKDRLIPDLDVVFRAKICHHLC